MVLVFVLGLSIYGYLFYRNRYNCTLDKEDYSFCVVFAIFGIVASLGIVLIVLGMVALVCLGIL